jgi:ribosomal protein S4
MNEKQKLRLQYGLLEKQFRRYYDEAHRRRGITGDILVQLLETRLDNVCYRLGLGNTRRAARQLVGHGHVKVNGRRVDVPSYCVKPGDVISFTGTTGTSTENFGWVQELRGRYVVVRDRDGVETLVPNQNLITTPVINWSYSDRKVRLKLPVRISYDDDPEQALTVLLEAAKASPRVLRDPEPVSRLMHFSDHGIDLELRFWIADPENGVNNVRSDVTRAIWQHFKQARITIPVAQRDVRMVTTRGGGA